MAKHSLTDIKGIGAGAAKELAAAGFKTVEDVAKASPEDLSVAKGFDSCIALAVLFL